MCRFLGSKDPWRIVLRCVVQKEDFSVFESPTIVSSVSLEFLCSESLQAGQEQAAMEAGLFSRLCWMTVCVGTSQNQLWISSSSLVEILHLFLEWCTKNRPEEWITEFISVTHEFILTKKPPKNIITQVLIVNKRNISLLSSQHTKANLLFLGFFFFLFLFSLPR